MSIEEIIKYLQGFIGEEGVVGGVILLIMTCVEFSPIKINPWSSIKKICINILNGLGDLINHNVITKIDKMDREISDLKNSLSNLNCKIESVENKDDERDAINTRNRILSFGDDLMHGILHSEDSYEQALLDISHYNEYCKAHPDFKNNITSHHASLIEVRYAKHLENNDFLQ